MLSAESQVDVMLGLWKIICVTAVLFISVRSVGSQTESEGGSARGPQTHSMYLRKVYLRVK